MDSEATSAHERALQYISNPRFHQRFALPATSDHDELAVSYADVGRLPSDSEPNPPTILLIPGMFASRYLGVSLHAIAEKTGVRVLIVDRPGMGHSTDVPLEFRIKVWIELVPLLLSHLKIPHVILMSHSAGTMYILNTLYQCREVLHPEKPLAILLAPWVDPSCSHKTTWQIAQYLPVKAFSIWHLLPKFFMLQAAPVLATSGSVFNKVSNAISPEASANDTSLQARNRKRLAEVYGLDQELQAELETLVFKTMFDENTVGANSEALQCLRKGPKCTWEKCDNYRTFVKDFVDLERGRQSSQPGSKEKIKVMSYFAETDVMIGKQGQAYFEETWKGKGLGDIQDVIDFETTTVNGTDHDSVIQSVELLEKIFIAAGGTGVDAN